MARAHNKKPNSKQRFGKWGEDTAASFLVSKGYLIVDRNARTKYGEIDLVMQHDQRTVFVEVKTRSNTRFGYPEDSINEGKQRRLYKSAVAYLQANPHLDGDWRVDVVAIIKRRGAAPKIVHFEDAI